VGVFGFSCWLTSGYREGGWSGRLPVVGWETLVSFILCLLALLLRPLLPPISSDEEMLRVFKEGGSRAEDFVSVYLCRVFCFPMKRSAEVCSNVPCSANTPLLLSEVAAFRSFSSPSNPTVTPSHSALPSPSSFSLCSSSI
jgi:hypothetical protein